MNKPRFELWILLTVLTVIAHNIATDVRLGRVESKVRSLEFDRDFCRAHLDEVYRAKFIHYLVSGEP